MCDSALRLASPEPDLLVRCAALRCVALRFRACVACVVVLREAVCSFRWTLEFGLVGFDDKVPWVGSGASKAPAACHSLGLAAGPFPIWSTYR